MAYVMKLESRHTAKVMCRLIPSVSAIGTSASMRNLCEAIQSIAETHNVFGEARAVNVFYTVEFECTYSAMAASHAAREFITWLNARKDFVEA